MTGALVNGAPDVGGLKTNGVNSALNGLGVGPNQGDAAPAAYLNYILFDQYYNVVNAGWNVVPTGAFSQQYVSIPTVTVKEAGYVFVYLSYEDQSSNWVYFDDFKVTITPTNILQANEYYPFGMLAPASWTRTTATPNNFLANGGTELNTTTGVYDLEFRNFDPVLGRMMQVDPMASSMPFHTPYHYSYNNPVSGNYLSCCWSPDQQHYFIV
ncbi:MAG: hypothetical protein JST43_09625 [Bacteroidetes bacterium]|nr:hypothetical protein [Bacteroidota bacterium]